ncbi:PREDICTED: uncharacterized protein LOC104789463 [Camelina sativa]|uniref:Uncharacterized protein LOC104789463 n=1 Tax=Camelina sativa TaxID=90675 RepID=A0ABM0ZBV4_CAMSA|nr:PREDICTED: uncharacterized protein LOC104789463 [Camelina sativa]
MATTHASNGPVTTADPVVTTTPTLFNMKTSSVMKLNSTNYLMWSLQINALFDGYELCGYLDGFVVLLPATVTVDTIITVNPAFTFWNRQDKLLYSALIGAISSPFQPQVSRATIASELWQTLAATIAKPSRGHIKQLKTQLKQWVKGARSIDEYVQGLSRRMDQLEILGKPFDLEDQIEVILEGLPEEYKPVIDHIEGKDTPPTIVDVPERLWNNEAKLLSTAAVASLATPITANVVQSRHNSNNYRTQQRFKQTNNSGTASSQGPSHHYEPRGFKLYMGSVKFTVSKGIVPDVVFSFNTLCLLHRYHKSLSFTPWNPRANLAVASPWVLDSGATHHITSDLNNLSLHQPYHGGDEVFVADGSTVPITHTGELSEYGGPLLCGRTKDDCMNGRSRFTE